MVVAASLVAGGMFASAVAGHWQTFLLWRHRQTFGVVDPVHGRDVGFFVFSLPFELLVCQVLLWLVAVTTISVALVYAGQGKLGWRTRHATFDAQLHLAVMVALFLLAVAWRIRLQTYLLELAQPSPRDPDSFSGADYVDVHVRMPGLGLLSILTVVLAVACVAAPLVARRHGRRQAHVLVGVPLLLLVAATVLVGVVAPALVQRYVVDPNPLLREQPLLEQSIAGTRHGLGLDTVGVQPYQPTPQLRRRRLCSAHAALEQGSDLGQRSAGGADASAGDGHAVLQAGGPVARRRPRRRPASTHGGQCP